MNFEKIRAFLTSERFLRFMRIGIATGLVVDILLAGMLSYAVAEDLSATYSGIGINPFRPRARETQIAAPTEPGTTPTPIPIVITPEPWEGSERVTILLMGLDYRDWVANFGAPRSDTMFLVSIDPVTQQAGMLSIPRDLWVEIPGFGFNRINTAYMFGEAYHLPGGGPGLAMQVVENLLGVPIQYYAVVEFYTFEKLIDEIGGVDVEVKERIKIAPIGRDAFWLDPKPYHLDGAETLAYARVRKYGGGDFGRAERQQQVALAVLDRVVGFDMIPTLVRKAPTLFQQLSEGVNTNMSLQEMIAIGWLAVSIPKENISRGVISPPNMIAFHVRPDGANVLRAVPDQIRILRNEIFVGTSGFHPYLPENEEEANEP
jgi:LCP family protein required for cell wall assembly